VPASGRTGWPWAEESRRLPAESFDGHPWPRVSVITPSFNQGEFIEETIRSVLLQGYPDLEYIILDGGSTDNSVEIIKKYSPWLSFWVSGTDAGQSDAINRGLKRASGEFATWINSDDMLCENAFVRHATEAGFAANTVYAGICVYIDQAGEVLSSHRGKVHCLEDLVRIGRVWRAGGQIVQPEVLFPRQLALSVGGLNPDNHRTMDYELWGKFFLAGAEFRYTDIPFGMFREQPNQKTQNVLEQTDSLLDMAATLVLQSECFSTEVKQQLLGELRDYRRNYEARCWRGSGRLARIGLPRSVVAPLRCLRARLQKRVEAMVAKNRAKPDGQSLV
jgi:hypothetical protein